MEIQPEVKEFVRNFFAFAGRFLAQNLLKWFLVIPFIYVFAISAEGWGHNESLIAIQELVVWFITAGSVSIVAKLVDDYELEDFGLKKNLQAVVDFSAGVLITFLVLGLSFVVTTQ